MAEKRKPLGKGLNALFSDITADTVEHSVSVLTENKEEKSKEQVVSLKLIDIEPNKGQPRKHFDEEKLESLKNSILEHGLIEPILVTPTQSGTYKIVAGERRWRASKLAGLKEIPCIIRSFEKQQVMELALVENLQREDLNPIEEAEGYQQLIDTFSFTQEEISKRIGKSRSAVANALRLIHLPKEIKEMVVKGLLSQGHARALLSVEDAVLQQNLANQIVKEGLNVRQVEKLVSSLSQEKKPTPKKEKDSMMQKYIKELENNLSSKFGTKVKISDGAKKGKIEIEYYSKDDLDRILFELRR